MKSFAKPKEITRLKIKGTLFAVLILFLLSGFYGFPVVWNKSSDFLNAKVGFSIGHLNPEKFRLGLDLRGGAFLMYDVDTSEVAQEDQASAVEGARDVIERRVNAFGVGEPLVQTTRSGGMWRVLVELPDVHDVKEAIAMIGATPILEFRDKSGGEIALTDDQKKQLAESQTKAKKDAEDARIALKSGTSLDELAKKYNPKQFETGDFGFIDQQSEPALWKWGGTHREGTQSDIIETDRAYFLVQRGKDEKQEQVHARHILICWAGSEKCNSTFSKEDALQKINEQLLKATTQNFADLAKINSTEPGAAESGGDLGFFGKGAMVSEFENAVFGIKNGEIKGPVETKFGYHAIYRIEDKINQRYEFKGVVIRKPQAEDLFANVAEWKPTGLSGKYLKRATLSFDPNSNAPTVSLDFNSEGADLFAAITKRNVGQQVAIFLDGSPISAPVVQQEILDGRAIISGKFTLQEAQKLVERLNAGALPLPIKLVSQQTVGATLGSRSLTQSAYAGLIGFAFVFIFMIAYYRLPGLLAAVALVIYAGLVLAVFKFVPVTLTLAGIAGFILSIGMAVDANILIFERTREELALGKLPIAALEEAFPRAWASIRDSNASSLITCAILYWFGSSIVRGFALTLAIGIVLSMFTAITVSRYLLRFLAPLLKQGSPLFLTAKK